MQKPLCPGREVARFGEAAKRERRGDSLTCKQNALERTLPFAVATNRRDSPIEKREEERASFILSPVERGTQSPQLNQLPLSPKWCQALYSGHWTLDTVCRLISDHAGHQWQLTQLWTLRPTFEGREYKGSAFFFPLFYGTVPSIRRDGKGEHTLY